MKANTEAVEQFKVKQEEDLTRYIAALEALGEEHPPTPTNYRKPSTLEIEDRATFPELYALRDEIARNGVPIQAANVLAREIYELKLMVRMNLLPAAQKCVK